MDERRSNNYALPVGLVHQQAIKLKNLVWSTLRSRRLAASGNGSGIAAQPFEISLQVGAEQDLAPPHGAADAVLLREPVESLVGCFPDAELREVDQGCSAGCADAISTPTSSMWRRKP
jgi:hypothetical protein